MAEKNDVRISNDVEAEISAVDVSKSVEGPEGRIDILSSVNFDVRKGASLAIVGASGSGKTTLLGLLAGLDTPTRGEITLAGTRIDALDEESRAALRRRYVGFLFQSFHLLPALNAEENVMLPLELDGRSDAREHARAALHDVGLDARRRHYPHQLSGGEQQRVALARAFVHRPRILFADEPTGNLDQKTGRVVGDLLFELNRSHATTLVLVTHDLTLAQRCAASVHLDGGKLATAAHA
ncbi:MAG: ATP-binding cassette domain-containing protein [Rudaea sp.]